MSAEKVGESGLGHNLFGDPPEPWPDEFLRDPTLKGAMFFGLPLVRTEAEMNTPQGRIKAAKAAEAERAEKNRAWGTRAMVLPLDGFEGIPDSAEDRELQIYTRTRDFKHIFWGIKPVAMSIWDFWDVYDPEVTRYDHRNHETPANPKPSRVPLPPMNPPQQVKSTVKPRRRQESSNINSTNRVRKSTTPPKVNNNTRKSLALKNDATASALENQVPVVKGEVRARGRPTRNKAGVTMSGVERKTAERKANVQDDISSQSKRPRGRGRLPGKGKPPNVQDDTPSQPKRPRGRPPAKGKPAERRSNQDKTPVVQGNVRVTKSSRKETHHVAPSTHKMRTRQAGPAESLQLP